MSTFFEWTTDVDVPVKQIFQIGPTHNELHKITSRNGIGYYAGRSKTPESVSVYNFIRSLHHNISML